MAITQQAALSIPENLIRVYNEIAVSPIRLLQNYAFTHIYSMIQKFEVEEKVFAQKYQCSFTEFSERIARMENEENFEWEDDLMDWEFAVENLKLWRTRLAEIETS